MNIKSLLLGSAAALVAVSGARAADAVMAEPEAVEYVRVCDAFGAGFFYIPGSETCLKIAGRVRYQINYNSITLSDGWGKQAQGLLNITAKTDTELGALTSYIEMEANNFSGGGQGAFGLAHAWISLGGLKMGYSDTLFDGGINGEFDSFGGAGVHFMGYTFTGASGFSFTLNLEEENFNTDYLPNIVAKASFTTGGVTLDAWAAYDDKDLPGFSDEFALKARLTAKVSDPFELQIGATYNSGPNFYDNDADWSVGASGKYKVNDKLTLTAGAQYFGGSYYTGNGEWAAGLVANYVIVPQFSVELAVNYHSDNNVGVFNGVPIAPTDGYVNGYLRFERSF